VIIGVLGLGRIGAAHARNIAAMEGVDLVVHDLDGTLQQGIAAETGARSVPSRDALIESCEGVVIGTPTANHPDDIAACVEAGKPMLCEKPISLDVATTEASIELAEEADVYLQVGFMRRFDPGFVEARRRIETGDLGDLYLIRAASHDHVPPHED
jgi:myo-inositol 2-dehydrogenase / D-chiro-inositol 1-dehydrogenase